MVKNFGPYLPPGDLTNVKETLFFHADDGTSGRELWKTDGTEAGTMLVKDILPGKVGSNPAHTRGGPRRLTAANQTLFFVHGGGVVRSDETDPGTLMPKSLWKSDGTEAGTVMVKSFGPIGSAGGLTDVNGTLFFTANNIINDLVNGNGLWKSDGTEAETVMVKGFQPDGPLRQVSELSNVDGTLFFSADDGINGVELWKSDGTEVGTVMVKDMNPGADPSSPSELTNVNGTLFFRANRRNSRNKLWKSDGSDAGTLMVKEFPASARGGGKQVSELSNVDGTLFFLADDGINGFELWKSDGTKAGTVMVKDINPGKGSSFLGLLTNVNGTLFFLITRNITLNTGDKEVWKSDGSKSGTRKVTAINGKTSRPVKHLTNVNGTLFFLFGRTSLWKIETKAGNAQ